MVGNDCDRSLFATMVGCQILADNFVLALIRKTWQGTIQGNDALIENISETDSNSELGKYLPEEDILESKSDNHGNDQNIIFLT